MAVAGHIQGRILIGLGAVEPTEIGTFELPIGADSADRSEQDAVTILSTCTVRAELARVLREAADALEVEDEATQ